jgi:hypothetical protein
VLEDLARRQEEEAGTYIFLLSFGEKANARLHMAPALFF